MIIFVILGLSSVLQTDNAFSVKTYALYQEEDGAIDIQEINLVNEVGAWGGYYDGQYFYVSIGLKYEGENIKTVEFSVNEGFFAKQYIEDNHEGVTRLYVGADNQLVVYGDDFEIVGDKASFDNEAINENLLLFWGVETSDAMNSIPAEINITAKCIFNDNTSQSQTITIVVADKEGAFVYPIGGDERKELDKQEEYYSNISLNQCELIPESVQAVTDTYKCENGEVFNFDVTETTFDENGIFRCGRFENNGETFILVIERNNSGEIMGMVYRIPNELVLNVD